MLNTLPSLRDLRVAQHHLRLEQHRLDLELAKLARQRNALMTHGAQSGSANLQRAYARKVRDLDRQSGQLAQRERLIQLQHQALAQLLFTFEVSDTAPTGLMARVDWVQLMREISASTVDHQRQIEHLQKIITLLGQSPVSAPQLPVPRPSPLAQPTLPAAQAAIPNPQPLIPDLPSFLVTHIPDGDGLALDDGTRVRYIGIDAPEMHGSDGQPEALALEAKAMNQQLVLGKQVRLRKDTSETDRYGRLLRYVYVGEVMVNAELVRAGLASAFMVPPDLKHAPDFMRIEAEARHAKRGLWAQGYV